ncbi:uncharacterized protein LOC131049627 [Cryptomeria japonica]|uniref:uncharacterized protein LOC131049627 n=1 Tax=Cryptomeria japonica TaxID=3369 RepID=UPI0025AD008B|nr:uncharacterized protein LOC131049627 [Cryptomeria japonica]
MIGSCGQPANLEDIFESVVNLEQQHIQQGYNEGFKEGIELGKVEGRDVGLKHGFEVGEELGFYRGCINVWKAALEIEPTVFSTRVHKQIKQLEELVDKYPVLEPENESVQDILESMRTKFKAISATLSGNLEYEGYPKSNNTEF